MKIIYSNKHTRHNPPFEIYDGVKEPYAENADRLTSIVRELQKANMQLTAPTRFSSSWILSLHQKEYMRFIKQRSQKRKTGDVLYPSYHIMDTYTPITKGTFAAASEAVNVALTGAQAIRQGERVVYSLCRPPGHHAEYKTMGGYCYFNNAAIAAQYLSQRGRVCILDVDFHHGNGTQNLFYDRSDVFYISLHADPHVKFPYSSGFRNERGVGEGLGFTKNYPLPLGTGNEVYLKTLRKVKHEIQKYQPDFLIVSLGFDTYEHDPIGGFRLTRLFYKHMAEEIISLNRPTLLIQEGGYNTSDLGKLAVSFLSGISAKENKV